MKVSPPWCCSHPPAPALRSAIPYTAKYFFATFLLDSVSVTPPAQTAPAESHPLVDLTLPRFRSALL